MISFASSDPAKHARIVQEASKRITSSRESSLEFLVEAGIDDPSGMKDLYVCLTGATGANRFELSL